MAGTLIIGIDGADWERTSRWLDAGRLPVLADLAEGGMLGPLRSTLPPVSSPAWPAMTTGFGPGSLGIFDLTVPEGYGNRIVSAADVGWPRLWDYVGAAGGGSIVVDVPVTYPPRPVEGALVCGLLSPPDSTYTHPGALGAELRRRFGYSPDHPTTRRGKLAAVRRRCDAFLFLLRTRPWNLAMLVFSATDWAQHDHWHDRAYVERLFREVDQAVGRIVEAADAENVAVISDHGFCGAERILNLNRLLCDAGFLHYGRGRSRGTYAPNPGLRNDGRGLGRLLRPDRLLTLLHRFGIERALDLVPNWLWQAAKSHLPVWDTPIDWSRTRAYLYNGLPQTIRVNLAGREPDGIVPPGDYDDVCAELVTVLEGARDPIDGQPIFTDVLPREEAWPGSDPECAPDLVFGVRDDAYLVSPADHPQVVWSTGRARGRHRARGIYLLSGPAFRTGRGPEAQLLDMTPTLLCASGYPPPANVDGRPNTELLRREPLAVSTSYGLRVRQGAGSTDAADVRRRLQDLGYM